MVNEHEQGSAGYENDPGLMIHSKIRQWVLDLIPADAPIHPISLDAASSMYPKTLRSTEYDLTVPLRIAGVSVEFSSITASATDDPGIGEESYTLELRRQRTSEPLVTLSTSTGRNKAVLETNLPSSRTLNQARKPFDELHDIQKPAVGIFYGNVFSALRKSVDEGALRQSQAPVEFAPRSPEQIAESHFNKLVKDLSVVPSGENPAQRTYDYDGVYQIEEPFDFVFFEPGVTLPTTVKYLKVVRYEDPDDYVYIVHAGDSLESVEGSPREHTLSTELGKGLTVLHQGIELATSFRGTDEEKMYYGGMFVDFVTKVRELQGQGKLKLLDPSS